jgi:hypothetical protein
VVYIKLSLLPINSGLIFHSLISSLTRRSFIAIGLSSGGTVRLRSCNKTSSAPTGGPRIAPPQAQPSRTLASAAAATSPTPRTVTRFPHATVASSHFRRRPMAASRRLVRDQPLRVHDLLGAGECARRRSSRGGQSGWGCRRERRAGVRPQRRCRRARPAAYRDGGRGVAGGGSGRRRSSGYGD